MKLPVCDICRSLYVVCEVCSKKLQQRSLSRLDFAVARALTSLEEEEPAASKAEFSRAFPLGPKLLLVSDNPSTLEPLLPQLGRLLRRQLSVAFPKADAPSLAKALSPLKFTKTQSFLPDGTTRTKLLFRKAQLKQLRIDRQTLKAIGKALSLEVSAV